MKNYKSYRLEVNKEVMEEFEQSLRIISVDERRKITKVEAFSRLIMETIRTNKLPKTI